MENKDTDWDIYTHYGYIKDKVPFSKDMMVGDAYETVSNRFTGIKVKLNPVEVAVYDVLMGSYNLHLQVGKSNIEQSRELYNDFNKGKNWFIENNSQAYFDLID